MDEFFKSLLDSNAMVLSGDAVIQEDNFFLCSVEPHEGYARSSHLNVNTQTEDIDAFENSDVFTDRLLNGDDGLISAESVSTMNGLDANCMKSNPSFRTTMGSDSSQYVNFRGPIGSGMSYIPEPFSPNKFKRPIALSAVIPPNDLQPHSFHEMESARASKNVCLQPLDNRLPDIPEHDIGEFLDHAAIASSVGQHLQLPNDLCGNYHGVDDATLMHGALKLLPPAISDISVHLANNPYDVPSRGGLKNEGNVGVKPRARARRGEATDPHSIAERNRREKISERMRNLQELVPSSCKVDKATMLDEIIQYVKFLQIQVKVLSVSRLGATGAVPPFADQDERSGQFLLPSSCVRKELDLPETEDSVALEKEVVQLMETSVTSTMQYLQTKGLCLMPIALAAAISNQKGNLEAPLR